jgi:cytochrome c
MVTDAAGEKAGKEIEILAGNEPPKVKFEITKGNKTFFFPNQPFEYAVTVDDKEDGSLADGRIEPEEVSIRIDYLAEGFDKVEIAQGHLSADAFAKFAKGKKLIDQNDCKSCHIIDRKSIGPTYKDVAAKYKDDAKAVDYLVKKVIQGGTGVWGEVAMAAHPQLSVSDASEMVNYILSLAHEEKIVQRPPQGTYTPKATSIDGKGVYIMRAAYTDNGANGIEASTAEKTLILKSASFQASIADEIDGVQRFKLPQPPMDLMIGSRNGG